MCEEMPGRRKLGEIIAWSFTKVLSKFSNAGSFWARVKFIIT